MITLKMPRKQRKKAMTEAAKRYFERRKTNGDISSEEDSSDYTISTSERKLFADLFDYDFGDNNAIEQHDSSGFHILDLQSIAKWIGEAAVCRACKKGKLILQETLENKQGFFVPMELVCCRCKIKTTMPGRTIGETKVPEVNRRAVLAFRVIGAGQKKMEKFCGVMNMPSPLSHRSYDKHVLELHGAVSTVVHEEMKAASTRLHEHHHTLDDEVHTPLDAAVSADGTWATRGFTSLHGLVFIISQETGEVLDFTLMSRHCPACNYHQRVLSSEEFLS